MARFSPNTTLAFIVASTLPALAHAGIPECGDIRIEADAHCGIEFSCSAGCSVEVYKKNCATRLYKYCQEECETPPSVVCTDDCGAFCASQCAEGIDVICQHNCFPECVDSCHLTCDSDVDPERCRASCEATCDGECTMQCAELPPNTSCVKHCEECCTGSCRAIAGMNCQVSCQELEFEDCETEVDAECHAGCEGSGALFCDGEFIAGPAQLFECAKGLAAAGIETAGYDIDVKAEISEIEAKVDVEAVTEDLTKANERGKKGTSCAVTNLGAQPSNSGAFAAGVALLALWFSRRRQSTK